MATPLGEAFPQQLAGLIMAIVGMVVGSLIPREPARPEPDKASGGGDARLAAAPSCPIPSQCLTLGDSTSSLLPRHVLMWGLEIAVMLAMIGVNSIFAGYEIALASITVARLQRLATDKRAGAKVALYMKENMEASLAVVQLGITLVGAIAAAVGGAGAEDNLAPGFKRRLVSNADGGSLAIAGVVLPLTVLTIIFGELIPKVFAIRNAEWVCLRLSPFMRCLLSASGRRCGCLKRSSWA